MRKPRRFTPEELAPYQLDLPFARPDLPPPAEGTPPPEPLDWAALFGNANPLEMEVGFGKGLYLVRAGETTPGKNFVGVEIVRKYQLYATGRVATRALPNVKTACADAKRVLALYTRPASLDALHVYFPDPWWKSRHKKRLLFTPEFAQLVVRSLKPGGVLHFATDVADYFEWVTGTLAAVPELREQERPAEAAPAHDMDYLTNFERKFRKEGRPIYRSRYERA